MCRITTQAIWANRLGALRPALKVYLATSSHVIRSSSACQAHSRITLDRLLLSEEIVFEITLVSNSGAFDAS